MTFKFFEISRYLGKPVNLYFFRYGSAPSAFYAYTDAEQAITYNTVTYRPIAIKRDTIKASGTLDKALLEIRMSHSTPLVDLFRGYPPAQVVTLTIRQGHLNDPDGEFLVAWAGRVLNFGIEGNEAKFACEPVSTSMQRPALRRNYQYGCPHALYGPQCQADRTAATTVTEIVNMTSNTLTFTDGWAGPIDTTKFLGGMIHWDYQSNTIYRSILRVLSATTIQITGTLQGLAAGMNVNVVLGCNHQMDDCQNLHNNILNYGGQPWIPVKNPIGVSTPF